MTCLEGTGKGLTLAWPENQPSQNCIDSYDLLATPALSTLQAILLLATSPQFSQQSFLVLCACRMALILRLHYDTGSRSVL